MKKEISVLIGDIGGTNTRLELIKINKEQKTSEIQIIEKSNYTTYNFPSIASIIINFLNKYQSSENFPKFAAFGIPGVVINNKIDKSRLCPDLNNLSGKEMAEKIGIEKVYFLNDISVSGYAIRSDSLEENVDYIQINNGVKQENDLNKLIVAPGSGLGIGFLTKNLQENNYSIFPSEAGSSYFSPINEKQKKFQNFLSNTYNINNPQTSLFCRGDTLNKIIKFFYEEENIKGIDEIIDYLNNCDNDREKINMLNKLIVDYGINNKCNLCKKSIDFFIQLLATICLNLSLTFLPFGGIYLLGGITVGLAKYIQNNNVMFINYFANNEILSNVIKKIPIYAVINPDIGLNGAAFFAKEILNGKFN